MKRKELFRRLSAVSMAAMMTVTAVPAESFAADIEFTDSDQETTEADVDLADTEEEPQADVEEPQIEDTQEPADEAGEADVFSDGEDAAGDAVDLQDGTEETTPAADATVHMTISVAGVLADAKDGTAMAERDVTVKDLDGNGILTYDEALSAAHDEYYEGGAAAGYESADSQYGLSLVKLWGDASGAFGYWLNDTSCSNLSEVVKADDDLTAFVYKDQTAWSDSYTKFGQKEYQATAGKAFTVSVDKASYDENYNTVFSAYDGAKLTAYDSEYKPLAAEAYSVDGYNVTFNQAGTYYLTTAGTDDVNLVPAVAKVTVGAAENVEQKAYLQNLKLTEDVTDNPDDYTEIIKDGGNVGEYSIPADQNGVYVWAKLSENAPEGSTIQVEYTKTSGEVVSKEIREASESWIAGMCEWRSMEPGNAVTLTVGVEGNTQQYIINFPSRSLAISSVDITKKDGTDFIESNETYYLKEDEECDSIKVSAYGCGAALTINGEKAEDGEEQEIPLSFDENREFKVNLTVTYGDDSLTQTYKIKKLASDDVVTGQVNDTVSWSLKNGILTFEGTGEIDSANSWKSFAGMIKEVVIGEGITSLCNSAFRSTSRSAYDSLEKVTLPQTLTKMGTYAFQSCAALKEITIPEGVTSIGNYAFQKCTALKEVTIPDSVTSLGNYCFSEDTALETVTTKVLGYSAFSRCNNLKNLTLKPGLTEISEWAFQNCTSLESLVIPEGVQKIDSNAFYKCSGLKEVAIPEGITSIEGAFSGCTGLQKVSLPSTLESVNGTLFAGSTNLTDVQISGDKYVVDGKFVYTQDKKTLAWCLPSFSGKLEVPSGVTALGDYAIYSNCMVTEVSLPDTLETIGAGAFYDCEKLTELTIPESVTSIGQEAFQYCTKLVSIKLPSKLTEISPWMFTYCYSLAQISIPDTVTTIGRNAFDSCKSLETVTFPESVTTLDYGIFYKCTGLKEFTVPSKVTDLPNMMFGYCSALEKVYIPVSVTTITGTPFSENDNLKYVFYEGTPQQWDAITAENTLGKPEPPYHSSMLLFGCTSVGDNVNAPKVAENPKDQIIKDGQEMTALEAKAEPLTEEGSRYYFDWFKKTGGKVYRVPSTPSEDGMGSYCMPEAATKDSVEYYCMVEKVDANGAATWTYSDSASVALGMSEFQGSGTASDPYQLATSDDLVALRKMVNEDGTSMSGICFKFTADITLPEGWSPIGATIDGSNNINRGQNLHAFSGIIDGDGKTLTVPEEGLPLLGYVQNAEVRNLNIYGKKIAGYGLVNNFEGVGLSGSAIVIDNVTLKSGSSTLKSGLIGANITTNSFAGCSAGFVATIRNCTVEEGVVVGYNKDQKIIGSIAGRLQGTIENCVSNAAVYGAEYVGGIVGARDNAMGESIVKNCTFGGTVEASGTHAGGIVGGGYNDSSAPNGIHMKINNCSASGTVIGADKVGGILGADTYIAQAWNAYTMKGNSFTGKVQATGENASYIGGIIGFYDSLNKFDDITNNYYAKDCGAAKGIGFVQYVDTNCATHETASGATYINSENGTEGFPSVAGCNWKAQHNRTDDPLGADASKLTNTEGVKLYAEKLGLSGDYRTEFYQGEDLDLTGMVIKAQMSDGSTKDLAVSDLTIEGYDKDGHGEQTLTLSYSGASTQIVVKVLKKDPEDIKVHFMLLGDQIHNSTEDKTYHTLHAGNLETWLADSEYEVGGNATVLDVFEEVMTGNGYTWENAKGNYISSITKPDGTKLGEFTNGEMSGWMYTLNGIHSDLSVVQQYLEDGDTIVFHYTDDYTKEHDHIWSSKWTSDKNAHWHECTYQWSACDITDNAKKNGYGAHTFDNGVVTKKATYTATGVKTYTCTVCGYKKIQTIPVVAHSHKYVWKTISKATIYQPQKQRGTCSLCKKTTTRNYGSKLKATIKLNVSSITLQKKQATKRVRVTMANGDAIKSWTSSNRKIVTVDKTGRIQAQNRTGSAKITVTLKSGKKAVLNVKVQSAKVRTTKISGLKSSMTLKKGQKTTLKPVLSPLTTLEKVTYTSSNKNIATVSSKGVITAKKKGTAKITVRSGKKSFVIKVTVK